MSDKGLKLLMWILIGVLLIGSALFCFNSYTIAKNQRSEVSEKNKEIAKLEKELADVEDEYSKSLNAEVSKSYDVSMSRVNRDEKLIKSILVKSFEYESSDEYNKNRDFVGKYVPKDSNFMKEYFIEDIPSEDGDSSFIESLDIKRKCTLCDIYYTDKNDKIYRYLAHVKSIPYLNEDINRSSHMHADQYLISIDVDESGKIQKFNYNVCYVD